MSSLSNLAVETTQIKEEIVKCHKALKNKLQSNLDEGRQYKLLELINLVPPTTTHTSTLLTTSDSIKDLINDTTTIKTNVLQCHTILKSKLKGLDTSKQYRLIDLINLVSVGDEGEVEQEVPTTPIVETVEYSVKNPIFNLITKGKENYIYHDYPESGRSSIKLLTRDFEEIKTLGSGYGKMGVVSIPERNSIVVCPSSGSAVEISLEDTPLITYPNKLGGEWGGKNNRSDIFVFASKYRPLSCFTKKGELWGYPSNNRDLRDLKVYNDEVYFVLNKEIRVVDISTGRMVRTLSSSEYDGYPSGIEFGIDGNIIYSAGYSRVQIINKESGEIIKTIGVRGYDDIFGCQQDKYGNYYHGCARTGTLTKKSPEGQDIWSIDLKGADITKILIEDTTIHCWGDRQSSLSGEKAPYRLTIVKQIPN